MTGGGAKTGCFCKGSGGTYEFRTTKSFEVRQRSGVKPEIISVDGIKNHPNALFPEPPLLWPISERSTDMSVKGKVKEATGFIKEEMSTASLLKAKQRRRKVVIYATKAGLKTARRRKRPSLVPAIRKSKRMMPSPPKRGGIIKSGVSCLTADVPLSRGSPRSHARMRSAPTGRTCAVGPLI